MCLAAVLTVTVGVACAVPGAWADNHFVLMPSPPYPYETCSIGVWDNVGHGGQFTVGGPWFVDEEFFEPIMVLHNNGSLNARVTIGLGVWAVDPPAGRHFEAGSNFDWDALTWLPSELTVVAHDCVHGNGIGPARCDWYSPLYDPFGRGDFVLLPGEAKIMHFAAPYNFSVVHADRLVQQVHYHASCVFPGNILPNGTVLHPFRSGMHHELLESLATVELVAYPHGLPRAVNVTGPLAPGNVTGPPVAGVPIVIELGRADRAVPINVTAVGLAASLTIDVGGLAGSVLDGTSASTVTFPPSETVAATSFVTVSFPPGVTAAHVPADGRLDLRVSTSVPDGGKVQGALGYDGSGRVTLQRVIEVGSGAGRVTFDMPVRIFLEGQAGGRAFYIDGGAGGAIMPIDEACAADDVDRVHVQLGGAGECHVDSADGGKVIYTYHLTRFGTALPENAAPLPTIYTCAVGVGAADLDMRAAPGGYSEPVRQAISNRGTLSFEHVDLMVTPWHIENDGGSGAGAEPLLPAAPPAGVTEVLDVDAGDGGYTSVAEGTAVARGLGGGDIAPLLFRLNLTAYGGLQEGAMAQNVTYQATCGPP